MDNKIIYGIVGLVALGLILFFIAPSFSSNSGQAIAIGPSSCAGQNKVCLAQKPYYCLGGKTTQDCTKCGCPTGQSCTDSLSCSKSNPTANNTPQPTVTILPPGSIYGVTDPVGASMYVDNTFKGLTPTTVPASIGLHGVKFTKTGYQSYTQNVVVSSGQTVTVSAILVSNITISPSPQPNVTISPTPSVQPNVTVSPTTYPNATVSPSPFPNATNTPTPSPNPANGTLSAESDPSGAGVYLALEGAPYPYPQWGVTPLTISLLQGNYVVEFKKTGYNSIIKTATITSGQTTYVAANWTSNSTNATI